MSELDLCVTPTRRRLRREGFYALVAALDHETSTDERLKVLLRTASKRNSGNLGKPDLFGISDVSAPMRVVLLVECKTSAGKHCKDETNLLDADAPEQYACSGVVHYMRAARAESIKTGQCVSYALVGVAATRAPDGSDNVRLTTFVCPPFSTVCVALPDSSLQTLLPYLGLWTGHASHVHLRFGEYACFYQRDVVVHPRFQRSFDGEHRNALATYFRAHPVVHGVIRLGYCLGATGALQCIDGQHRLKALDDVYGTGTDEFRKSLDASRFTIAIVPFDSVDALVQDYLAHNQHKAVSENEKARAELVVCNDIPSETSSLRIAIAAFVSALRTRWPRTVRNILLSKPHMISEKRLDEQLTLLLLGSDGKPTVRGRALVGAHSTPEACSAHLLAESKLLNEEMMREFAHHGNTVGFLGKYRTKRILEVTANSMEQCRESQCFLGVASPPAMWLERITRSGDVSRISQTRG